MRPNHFLKSHVSRWSAAFVATIALVFGAAAPGQQAQLTEPVYRVASDTATAPAATAVPVAAPASVAGPGTPSITFDLAQKPGEHPIAPVLRTAKQILAHIDQDVRDYTCTLVKQERVDGDLGDAQNIFLKVRNQPFSVYMYFLKPMQGREVLYVDGQNNNELLVLECGWKRMAGRVSLDPNGMLAMSGQKYPITRVGLHNLVSQWIEASEVSLQHDDSVVTVDPNSSFNKRPATLIQVTHQQPQKYFHAHVTRFFIDNELKVPILYDAYLWPEKPGEKPELSESYMYLNSKVNTGLTATDFDPNNGQIFNK